MSLRTLAADARYSFIARRTGMKGSLRALWEARAAGVDPSMALALRQQETGLRGGGNIFGHDLTIYIGAGRVTKGKYLAYKHKRGPRGEGGMQGVGPLQLTYWSIQDEADRQGGCWKPAINYRVGYAHLGELIRLHGKRKALAVWNGGESNPNYRFADHALGLEREWHARLHGPPHP